MSYLFYNVVIPWDNRVNDIIDWCYDVFPSKGNGPIWGFMKNYDEENILFWFSTEEDRTLFKLTWL